MFAGNDIQNYLSDYAGEYENIIVKEAFEIYPNLTYPMIAVQEIQNTTATQYKDESGEFATALGYQINISCEQNETYTANENIRRIATIIDNYLQSSERYRCLDRTGGVQPLPKVSDPNVMEGHLRYVCNLVASQNTIYRRY